MLIWRENIYKWDILELEDMLIIKVGLNIRNKLVNNWKEELVKILKLKVQEYSMKNGRKLKKIKNIRGWRRNGRLNMVDFCRFIDYFYKFINN